MPSIGAFVRYFLVLRTCFAWLDTDRCVARATSHAHPSTQHFQYLHSISSGRPDHGALHIANTANLAQPRHGDAYRVNLGRVSFISFYVSTYTDTAISMHEFNRTVVVEPVYEFLVWPLRANNSLMEVSSGQIRTVWNTFRMLVVIWLAIISRRILLGQFHDYIRYSSLSSVDESGHLRLSMGRLASLYWLRWVGSSGNDSIGNVNNIINCKSSQPDDNDPDTRNADPL